MYYTFSRGATGQKYVHTGKICGHFKTLIKVKSDSKSLQTYRLDASNLLKNIFPTTFCFAISCVTSNMQRHLFVQKRIENLHIKWRLRNISQSRRV